MEQKVETVDKRVDQAILKVAYILTNLNGCENKPNKDVFKEVAKEFSWFTPGAPETDHFVLELIETVKELEKLRCLYDESEYFQAVIAKMKKECDTIKIKTDSIVTVRKAFVIWITICFADNCFSDMERKILEALQAYMNEYNAIQGVMTGGVLSSVFFSTMLGKPAEKTSPEALETKESVISSTFLHEAIEIIKLLGELRAYMDTTFDEAQKKSIQKSIEIMQAILNSKILDNN